MKKTFLSFHFFRTQKINPALLTPVNKQKSISSGKFNRNQTILDYLESKNCKDKQNCVKFLTDLKKTTVPSNRNQTILQNFPSNNPKFFRFSNDMMLNLKGILKYQEKNMKKCDFDKNKSSLTFQKVPWSNGIKARSGSLRIERKFSSRIKFQKKSLSLQNLFIIHDFPEKNTNVLENQKNFLLMEKQKKLKVHSKNLKQKAKISKNNWEELEKETNNIMEKLTEANINLRNLKEKLTLRKSLK